MRKKITYDQAVEDFPTQVREIEQQLRDSKSKNNKEPIKNFNFEIRTFEVISGPSLLGTQLDGDDEEKISKRLINTTAYLVGNFKQWRRLIKLNHVPNVIIEEMREQYEKQREERIEFESLTSDEQKESIEKSIGELRKYGGFGVF